MLIKLDYKGKKRIFVVERFDHNITSTTFLITCENDSYWFIKVNDIWENIGANRMPVECLSQVFSELKKLV